MMEERGYFYTSKDLFKRRGGIGDLTIEDYLRFTISDCLESGAIARTFWSESFDAMWG